MIKTTPCMTHFSVLWQCVFWMDFASPDLSAALSLKNETIQKYLVRLTPHPPVRLANRSLRMTALSSTKCSITLRGTDATLSKLLHACAPSARLCTHENRPASRPSLVKNRGHAWVHSVISFSYKVQVLLFLRSTNICTWKIRLCPSDILRILSVP